MLHVIIRDDPFLSDDLRDQRSNPFVILMLIIVVVKVSALHVVRRIAINERLLRPALAGQMFTKSMMVSPQDKRFAEIEDLWDKVFADRDCIEPDEPEMWKTYV